MAEDIRVNYLFMSLSGRAYRRLHAVLVGLLIIAAVAFFLLARDSPFWLLRHAWWICAVTAVLDGLEAWLALRWAGARPRVRSDERA